MANLSYYEMYKSYSKIKAFRRSGIAFFILSLIVFGYNFVSYQILNDPQEHDTQAPKTETSTIVPPGAYSFSWSTQEPEQNEKLVLVIADGVCVDKALAVLSILERNGKMNDNIRLAIGPAGDSWHVQVVETNGGITIYYDIDDSFDVITSQSQFNIEPPVFYKPEPFKKIAMGHNPLTYELIRDLYVQNGN